ncbi:S41 family peptidase [Candidatus Zixiibacteriota bacterium]
MKRFDTYLRPLSLSLIMLLCFCGRESRSPTDRFSAQQLQEDFGRLQTQITSRHAGYFTNRGALARAFDRQAALLKDSMTLIEFYRLIAPVLAQTKCGHTRLSLPESAERRLAEKGNFLPLEIRVLDDSLFILKSYVETPFIAPGSAVLSINGEPADEIINRLKQRLPADGDNETYKYYTMNNDFAALYLLFIDDPLEFAVSYLAPGAEQENTMRLPAKSGKTIRQFAVEHDLVDENPPLITHSFSPDGRYAVLRIRFFDFYDNLDDFVQAIDDFFAELSARKTEALILDLRGNDGGDPYSSAYLLTYLIGKPYRYFAERSAYSYEDLKGLQHIPDNPFNGELYVLVDGGCYSTTGHFCSLLKYHQVGVFIGEETGGSYACNGGYRDVCLEHTGICFLLPHTTFITEVHGLTRGRGIMPDYAVQPSIFDILNGVDPVLEKAKSLINEAE